MGAWPQSNLAADPMTKRNRASDQEILQVRAAMAIAFPNCFAPKGAMKRPLKIGISKDLMIESRKLFPGMTRRLITCFLHDYCDGHNYHVAVRKGVVRVSLDGTFTGFVSEEEAANAERALKAIEARKKVQRGAAGPAASSFGEPVKSSVRKPAPVLTPIEAAQRDITRLQQAQMSSEQSDGRYFSSGRKARDDGEIMAARRRLADLMRKQG